MQHPVKAPVSSLRIYLRLLRYLQPFLGLFAISLLGFIIFASAQPIMKSRVQSKNGLHPAFTLVDSFRRRGGDGRLFSHPGLLPGWRNRTPHPPSPYCACKARIDSFASAQRQRSRGEGEDEGQRRRGPTFALAGGNERLLLPAKVLAGLA